ncbi:hypothetical protein ACFL58_04110 [Elusimicrobiota bacterium]
MKKLFAASLLPISLMFVLSSCGNDYLPPPRTDRQIQLPAPESYKFERQKIKKYVYAASQYRDPFIPIEGEAFSSQGEIVFPNLTTLRLSGIVTDRGRKIALLKGGSVGYFLRNSRLYDVRERLIKGWSGSIMKNKVIIVSGDRTKREIPLRDKDDY